MSANRQNGSDFGTMKRLMETHRWKFDVLVPNFENPVEIGSFSLDINREFENSQKCMRYFVKPSDPERVNFDLRKGCDTMIRKGKGRDFNTLRWIMEHLEKNPIHGKEDKTGQKTGASGGGRSMKDKGSSIPSHIQGSDDQNQANQDLAGLQKGLSEMKISKEEDVERNESLGASAGGKPRNLDTDFVCPRGLLVKLMCTPYELMNDWIIACTLHNGTYYLNEIPTEEIKEYAKRDDERRWWGWKIVQYLSADSEDGKPDPDAQFNNCEAYCTVVRTKLNNHSLVISGAVGALNIDEEKGRYYMWFKLTREFAHPGHVKTFKRFKLKNWWAQCFILGIQEMVCGFRDDNGVVHRLEFYKTRDLPGMARDIYNPWKPNVCLNFLDKFLSSIKSSIKTDDKKIVHILKWSPGGPVRCSQPLRDSEYNFLPDWYTDAVK